MALEVAREGSLTLDLATVISQAGWVPSYDVRLAPDAKTAELTFRAMVRQQTGEEWNNVDLTLSTARPAAGGAPPELYPWHISFFRPQPPMQAPMLYEKAAPAPAREMKARAGRMYGAAKDMVLPEEVPASVETAQISAEQSSVSFHIPRPLVEVPDSLRARNADGSIDIPRMREIQELRTGFESF